MKKLLHVENSDWHKLQDLVRGDVTYTVLYKILGYECDHIFSDGKDAIICYSNPPYPVWVWMREGTDEECVKNIVNCIKENFPIDKFNITISENTLIKLREIDEYFNGYQVKTKLLSYKLTDIKKIEHHCDGQMEIADQKDIAELAKIWQDMAFEMEGYEFDLEHCIESVSDQIKEKRLFIWRNSHEKIVATTNYGILDGFGKIAGVYTLPKYRRCGYAINLVREVTKIILAAELIPTLYTDGDYSASNDCYKKIGYEQVGQMLTIYKL